MSMITHYIKEYGLNKTLMKAYEKILKRIGLKESTTIFFERNFINNPPTKSHTQKGIVLSFLSKDLLEQFKRIKFFPFIDGNKLLNSTKHKVVVAIKNNQICGYLVLHFGESAHHIHSLGDWQLNSYEAWLGPTYVVKKHRGKGLNSIMLNYAATRCKEKKVRSIYTCINQKNAPSIKSFKKNNFKKIGSVSVRKDKSEQIFRDNNYRKKIILR